MEIRIFVPMLPVAKGRPRSTVRNGKLLVYTPSKTVKAEGIIREAVMRQKNRFPAGVPLKIHITVYRSRPASLSKKVVLPVTRPDWDNYAKLVTDALEKFAYWDDGQITTAVVAKRFGDTPGVEVWITEDKNE